jgi:hypothetical protein
VRGFLEGIEGLGLHLDQSVMVYGFVGVIEEEVMGRVESVGTSAMLNFKSRRMCRGRRI